MKTPKNRKAHKVERKEHFSWKTEKDYKIQKKSNNALLAVRQIIQPELESKWKEI